MSAQQAEQTAAILQTKVGQSLAGVTNLLAPPERSEAMLQAGASSLSVNVLTDIKELQEKTFECIEKVASLLQSQIDIAEEADRRERDQAAELAKERRQTAAGVGLGGDDMGGAGDGGFFDIANLKNILTLGLGSIFTLATLKNFGKMLGKRLLKGGIIASIVSVIADPIINFIDDELELELDTDTKKDIKTSLVGAGLGFAVAGIPGAIIGGTLPYISRVSDYIAGEMNAKEIKDSDFAMTALGGTVAAYFTTSKVAGLLALSKYPAISTFGLALGSVPVLIGVGAAVALGVGLNFVAKKIDEYQEDMLDTLAERMVELDKDMGEFAAKQSEGLFEKMGVQLGSLSALGQARVASEEALEQFGQNKEKFIANETQQGTLKALANTIAGYNDDALKTIMDDNTKSTSLFTTIESIKAIAAQGGFGNDSKEILSKMMAFSDNIQRVAKEQVEDGTASHIAVRIADNRYAPSMDQLEGAGIIQNRIAETEQKIIDTQNRIAEEEKKLQEMKDAGMGPDRNPFSKNEFETQEQLIKDLYSDIEDSQGLINSINQDFKKLNKFGSTNGFLFNMDDLRELYADDPEGLKTLIERSVNQQGTNFLNEQKQTETGNGMTVIQGGNNNNTTVVEGAKKSETYVGPLTTDSDGYFEKKSNNQVVSI